VIVTDAVFFGVDESAFRLNVQWLFGFAGWCEFSPDRWQKNSDHRILRKACGWITLASSPQHKESSEITDVTK
jgi:hypothetical protein